MNEFILDDAFFYVFLASAYMITWYRPLVYSLRSSPSDYHNWVTYWVALSGLLAIEKIFFFESSRNLAYFFFRTLFCFYLSERNFLNSQMENETFEVKIMKKIGNSTDVSWLCSVIDSDEEVSGIKNLHPWAPTPSTIGAFSICRIGEMASLKILTSKDEEVLLEKGLNKILKYLNDSEHAKSYNSLLCLLFLSELKLVRNRLVQSNFLPDLKRFVASKEKPLVAAALRLCRNIYHLNLDLQKDFVMSGMSEALVKSLNEHDPLSVLETFENIFSLICVKTI